MNPSAAQLRQLRRDNLAWPVCCTPVPIADWPARLVGEDGPPRIGLWRSRTYLVQLFEEPRGVLRMSVNRTDWDERQKRWREDISWDDLQQLKAEIGFGASVAVELFPPDDLIVNVANMRHLWILPEAPAFMWNGRKHLSEKRQLVSAQADAA